MNKYVIFTRHILETARPIRRRLRDARKKLQRDVAVGLVRLSDRLLMAKSKHPVYFPKPVSQTMGWWAGDIGAFVRDISGPQLWQLIGSQWSILYLGRKSGMRLIRQLVFDESVEERSLGRVPLWNSRFVAAKLLHNDVDMVVFESGRLQFGQPRGKVSFSVPVWVNQIIPIDRPLNELVAGNKRDAIRRKIRKHRERGFSYRVSCREKDYRHFYHHMYLPFVKTRHQDSAAISPYDRYWNLWFKKELGQLILVTRNDEVLAGMICYIDGDTCHSIEGGVLNADPELYRRGIWTYLNGCCIEWAQTLGAKYFSFGGSRPWQSDFVFESKRRWGAQVVARPRPTDRWTFVAYQVEPPLREHLNSLGLICEKSGKLYSVNFSSDTDTARESKLWLGTANSLGLDGALVIESATATTRELLVSENKTANG